MLPLWVFNAPVGLVGVRSERMKATVEFPAAGGCEIDDPHQLRSQA
jgi:hypothetical protein